MPPLVNVDPMNPNEGSPDPMRLLQYGIRGVRLVVRSADPPPDGDPEGKVRSYKATAQASGVMVLGTITEQSHGEMYADEPCDVYQLGNEQDRTDSPGRPDSKTPAQYVEWWNLYFDTWFGPGKPLEGIPVIAGGLSTGNVAYWRDVQRAAGPGGLRGAAGFAVHPYGKPPFVAQSLLLNYRAITPSLPVWVTEFHPSRAELPAFATMLRQTSWVVGHAYFCWHNYQEDGNNFYLGESQARVLGAFG